jgi:competence protein ComGC
MARRGTAKAGEKIGNRFVTGVILARLKITKSKITREAGFNLVDLLCVVLLIVVLAGLLIPYWEGNARRKIGKQRYDCINNLRAIQSAKEIWAFKEEREKSDTPNTADLQPYFLDWFKTKSYCPADPAKTFETSYTVGTVKDKPLCRILPTAHIMP